MHSQSVDESEESGEFSSQDIAAATAAALELQQVTQPMIIELSGFDAYLLVGLLQLTLKHPSLPLQTRAWSVGMVETLRMFFEAMDCSEVVRQIESGPRS